MRGQLSALVSRQVRSVLTRARLDQGPCAVHSRLASSTPGQELSTSVAIVGGGPTGVTLSLLLSSFGVDNIVIEKRSGVSEHPQAHFINMRTMEIFRQLGRVEERVLEQSPPLQEWRHFRYCESVLGLAFGKIDHFDEYSARSATLSPTGVAHLSQNRLLPILLEELKTHPTSTLLTGEDFLEMQCNSNSDGVRIRTANQEGQSKFINAKYLVGADGAHSKVRGQMTGVEMEGNSCLQSLVNVHFRSKALSKALAGKEAMLYFVYNPSVIAVIVSHNMEHGDFVAQIPFFPPVEKFSKYTEEHCLHLLWEAIGDRVDVSIRNIKPWTMSAVVANQFKKGRVFLAGDSAHSFPPAGGFGMNTGIQDAHNLAWKLAYVLREAISPSVLETYSEERRKVAIKNTCLSIANFQETVKVARAFGLDPDLAKGVVNVFSSGGGMPYLQQSMESLGDSLLSLGKMQTSPLNPLRPLQQLYLNNILNQEKSLRLLYPEEDIGFCYKDPELEWNGRDWAGLSKTNRSIFIPKVKIGSRFPHVFLNRVGGTPCDCFSTIDLISENKHTFLLFLHNPSKALDLHASIEELQGEQNYAVTPVFVNCKIDEAALSRVNGILVDTDFSNLKFESESSSNDLVVVCPDGHVADIMDLSAGCSPEAIRDRLARLGLSK